MNILFDVDYTIQGADGSLRPGTEEVFHNLIGDGHDLFVWSGVGIRTPDIKRHKLTSFISNVYQKPLEDFEKGLVTWKVTSRPHFVVDDHPEIVRVFGGFTCTPYFWRNANDTEMYEIYNVVKEITEKGYSTHHSYSPSLND